MRTLAIRNWDKWQSYRKDRGQPPWIKIHRNLMRDPAWVALTDAQRGQLISIWMLAGDRGGLIPDCPSLIKQLCFMKHRPDLQFFINQGFIENPDAKVTPSRRQDDAPETETETETETDKNTAGAVLTGTFLRVGEPLEVERPVTGPPVLPVSEVPKEGQPRKYEFEAGIIRLTKKHFDDWVSAFPNLDLRAELWSLSQWAESQPKWFHAVSAALAKRNREQKLKLEQARAGPVRRHSREDPMAGII